MAIEPEWTGRSDYKLTRSRASPRPWHGPRLQAQT